ncbi:unnamed protein product [Cyclocybe aegerita]|uniref:SET domain-containing protein n=1 Tax=Cyclocybe aegerita TaxID=1973307 RepID=A0A8S0X126_CYCAE|nr:unnamed protein product [Cyclocybe aegerita]
MSSKDSAIYPSSHPSSKRRGSNAAHHPSNSTIGTDAGTQCHPLPPDSYTTKRRKSVTFSAVSLASENQTIPLGPTTSRNRRESTSSPDGAVRSVAPPQIPVLNITANHQHTRGRRISVKTTDHVHAVPDAFESSPDSPSPRKRRFSNVAPPSEYSNPPRDGNVHHSPRKRRISVQPDNERATDHIRYAHLPHESKAISSAKLNSQAPKGHKPSVVYPPDQVPPPDLCAKVNDRLRTATDNSFDFAEHVRHRTYVVRSLPLAYGHECVVMLDAGVDALLPSEFPSISGVNGADFDVNKAPGKGLGLFARRLFQCNEIILVEHPVVITPYLVGPCVPLLDVYADMFGRLSAEVVQAISGLSSPGSWEDLEDSYETILRANSVAISLPIPKETFAELATHKALFLLASRCNHSCGPNSKWEWDEKRFSLVLTAVRQINPGDEITIAYVSPHIPFDRRRQALLDVFAFECLCLHCIKPKMEIQQSDADRHAVSTFWNVENVSSGPFARLPAFDKWCLEPSIPSYILIDAHRHALDIIRDEGLEILDTHPGSGPGHRGHPHRDVARHIDAIAMCYGALEDADNFLIWIKRAAAAREMGDPEQKLVFSKWMSNPMSFPVWGWRKAFCAGDAEEVKRLSKDMDSGAEKDDSTVGLAACIQMGMFGFIGK